MRRVGSCHVFLFFLVFVFLVPCILVCCLFWGVLGVFSPVLGHLKNQETKKMHTPRGGRCRELGPVMFFLFLFLFLFFWFLGFWFVLCLTEWLAKQVART